MPNKVSNFKGSLITNSFATKLPRVTIALWINHTLRKPTEFCHAYQKKKVVIIDSNPKMSTFVTEKEYNLLRVFSTTRLMLPMREPKNQFISAFPW
jgi:hypothetical protein